MNDTKKFYDLNAQKYADEWYPNNLMLPSIKEFIQLFTIKPRILDLGCGPGNESMRLGKEGAEVVGIDFSEVSIQIAIEKNPGMQFYCMDYNDISPKLGKFDGIFSCASLIHANKEDLLKYLEKLNTVINKNGFFLIIYRLGEGQIKQQPEINGIKLQRIIVQYTKEDLIRIFREREYTYIKDGIIDQSLCKYWHSLIFQKS